MKLIIITNQNRSWYLIKTSQKLHFNDYIYVDYETLANNLYDNDVEPLTNTNVQFFFKYFGFYLLFWFLVDVGELSD